MPVYACLICDVLLSIWSWLDLKAIGSLLGPLAAAYFGAYTAQRIIERRESRQRLLKEIRNISTAAYLTFGVTNTFFAMKKQHIKPLRDAYHSDKAGVLRRIEERARTADRKFSSTGAIWST
jgi:hypothetical protein